MVLRLFRSAPAAQAVGGAMRGVAEVFVPNATRRLELGHEAFRIAHETHGAEFQHQREGRFDRFVNGLNRLPRPVLALGSLGLFVFAMADPASFAVRMRGLAEVPEPLWWLMGAVVSFYFGAREAHYLRMGGARAPAAAQAPAAGGLAAEAKPGAAPSVPASDPASDPAHGAKAPDGLADAPNPALADWRAGPANR